MPLQKNARSGLCHTRYSRSPSHVLLKNRHQCVRIEVHLKWPSGRMTSLDLLYSKRKHWIWNLFNMQPCEWRSDTTAFNSSSYGQQHPSTSFCIDNILGKPTVTSAQHSPVAPMQCNVEQARYHDSYRAPAYPMIFPPRAYSNPFMAYQRHHPYAMPMGYNMNIQAPVIPSIYDAFQDPMGKHSAHYSSYYTYCQFILSRDEWLS